MIESHPTRRAAPTAPPQPGTTDRWVVVFDREVGDPAELLRSAGLVRVAAGTDALSGDATEDGGALVFPTLRMAVVPGGTAALERLREPGQGASAVLAVAPELVHHVYPEVRPEAYSEGSGGRSAYLEGYRDGVADLGERLLARGAPSPQQPPSPVVPPSGQQPQLRDDEVSTWGLKAVQATTSSVTGAGVRVAVLDTGFDPGHPDFASRDVTAESFVSGQGPEDVRGHGTHCLGTVGGPADPGEGPRYGVAPGVELFAGKVLSDEGSGTDAQILAGIEWALTNDCAVISMSLGSDVSEVSEVYTAVGLRALDLGTLIVAAAGNNAEGAGGDVGFTGAPANSPHIMAVAALDQQLGVADFSARSLPVSGGQIDIAGPGLEVYSSWPMPQRYNTISGTSMAAPHVAGVAALWTQATGRRGRELWAVLVQDAQRLLTPSADAGCGLALAPQ